VTAVCHSSAAPDGCSLATRFGAFPSYAVAVAALYRVRTAGPFPRMQDGGVLMRFVCDAGENTWFEIETEAEAALESDLMGHAVEKHFCQAYAAARASYVPPAGPFVEQEIGLSAYIRRTMPKFFTLRDPSGNGLATAMLRILPAAGPATQATIVGASNSDPYPEHQGAIRKLGEHFGVKLDRARCYPYLRR
jgi:hypothetical protein